MRKATKKATKRPKGLRSAKKLEAQKPLTGVSHDPIVVTKPVDVPSTGLYK